MDEGGQHSEYSTDFEEEDVQDGENSAHDIVRREQTKAQSYGQHQKKRTENSSNHGSKTKKVSGSRISSKLMSSPYKHTPASFSGSSPKDRVISARAHEISALRNELGEKRSALEGLRAENKLLRRLQARQEKELGRLQHSEGELPQILARHAQEVRALREQLRRAQEAGHAAERRLSEVREELNRVSGRARELEEAAKKKDLMERVALTLQLQQANDAIDLKDRKITELERNCEFLSKTHAQEVRALLSKNKNLLQETEDLKESLKMTKHHLKEKEKDLDVLNIYSQRISCSMPKGLPTRLYPPLMETTNVQTELSHPPTGAVTFHTVVTLAAIASQTETAAHFFQLPSPSVFPEVKQTTLQSPPAGPVAPLKTIDTERAPHAAPKNTTGIERAPYAVPVSTTGIERASHATPVNTTEIERAPYTAGILDEVKAPPPQMEAVINPIDGSHINTKSMKHIPEKDAGMPGGGGGTSIAGSHATPAEEEERQKKEVLLAKLRALSNGTSSSTLPTTRSTTEPSVASPSIPQGVLSTYPPDHQVESAVPLANTKGVGGALHTSAKEEVLPGLQAATEIRSDLNASTFKLNRPAGGQSSADFKQVLLAKLMGINQATPTEQTDPALSKGASKPTDLALSKQALLAKLMATDVGKEVEPLNRGSSTSGELRGDLLPEGVHSKGYSSESTPNKLENMHRGKPAFATDDDPFGFRTISAEKKKLKESKQGTTEGTFMTEYKSALPFQTKPKFGRRVQVPPSQGGPSIGEPPTLSSVQASQPYQPSFMALSKDKPAMVEHKSTSSTSGPQTYVLGGLGHAGVFSPEVTREAGEGVWSKKANLQGTSTAAAFRDGERPSKPLLPLRPKATESTLDIMPGAIQGDDDIEEITI